MVDARIALDTDPELIRATEQYELAWEVWEEGLSCHLLQPWQAPEVRLSALNGAFAPWRPERPLQCAQWSNPVDPEVIQLGILKDSQNNVPVLVQLYWGYCSTNKPMGWCEEANLPAKLKALDPTNAALALLPTASANSGEDSRPAVPDPIKSIDSDLASFTKFDLYYFHGMGAAAVAAEDYMQRYPPPEPGFALATAFDKAQARVSNYNLAMDSLLYSYGLLVSPVISPLFDKCKDYARTEDTNGISSCLKLASLMQDAPTMLSVGLGYALEQRTLGPDESNEKINRGWQRTIRSLVQACEMTQIFTLSGTNAHMPDEHFRQHYLDMEKYGEQGAYLRTAQREYVAHPELFKVNPARCANVHAFDEATKKDLAALHWCAEAHCGRDAALESMIELIKLPGLDTE